MLKITEAIKMTTQIIITCSEILEDIVEKYIRDEITGFDGTGLIIKVESDNRELLDKLYELDVIDDVTHKMSKDWLLEIVTVAKSHLWG